MSTKANSVDFKKLDDAMLAWHGLQERRDLWPLITEKIDIISEKMGDVSRIHIPESQAYIGVTFSSNTKQIGAYIARNHIDHLIELPNSHRRENAPTYWRTLIGNNNEEAGETSLILPSWNPHKDSENRRASAVACAIALLSARKDITTSHLKELLSIAIWKHTECDGKYKTRYQSIGAMTRPKEKLNHEHVVQRKILVEALLDNPSRCQEIFDSAIACTVLEEEHKQIMQIEKNQTELYGWDRYRAAQIAVYDLSTRERIV